MFIDTDLSVQMISILALIHFYVDGSGALQFSGLKFLGENEYVAQWEKR